LLNTKRGKMFKITKKFKKLKILEVPEDLELTDDEEYENAALTANGVGGFGNPAIDEIDEILHPKESEKES